MIWLPFLNFAFELLQHLFLSLNYLRRRQDNTPPMPPDIRMIMLIRRMYDLLKTLVRKKTKLRTKAHR